MNRADLKLKLCDVYCSSCGYRGELLSADAATDRWTQLRGFFRCNGCPECATGVLDVDNLALVDVPSPVGLLH